MIATAAEIEAIERAGEKTCIRVRMPAIAARFVVQSRLQTVLRTLAQASMREPALFRGVVEYRVQRSAVR